MNHAGRPLRGHTVLSILLAFQWPAGAAWADTPSASGTRPANPPTAELLAFHVKDKDFKPVDVAPWVYEGAVKAFLPPVDTPDTLDRIDRAAAAGVTVIHTGGFWPYAPLRRDDPDSGIPAAEAEHIHKAVARARQHRMRVILGVSPFAPVAMVKQHPEWMIHPTDDDSVRRKAEGDLTRPERAADRAMGLSSPFGELVIECLAEVTRDYGIDGYSFDGLYHPPIDFAPYMKAKFTADTGRPFPRGVDLRDLDYRIYLIWADDQLERFYRRLHARLREVNPEAAIYTWTTNAGRYGHFLTSPRVMSTRMNLLFDCPVQEWWLDEVNLGASVVPAFGAAYVRAVTGGRTGACEPYIISRGNPYSADCFPPHELLTRCLWAMTNGAFTPLSGMVGEEATRATFHEIRRRKPWITNARPLPWAALLVSEQTRQFYGMHDIIGNYLSHPLGVFRTAFEEHLPLALINDWDLTGENLARYRVLILANAACLSDEQVQAVREYVSSGGGLVATSDTSMFDELGRRRGEFALRDLFGVNYVGRVGEPQTRPALDANFAIVADDTYWALRSGVADLRWSAGDLQTSELVGDPRLKQILTRAQASFKGPLLRVSEPRPPMARAMIYFPEGRPAEPTGAVMGPFGLGRVVYLPVGLDAACFSYGYPYQRILLARAIRWAAREAIPVEIEAPMCVQATCFEQAQASGRGRRVIVHLFNGINTSSDHGLPQMDVPLREEAVPVAGIKVRFRDPALRRFRLEPDGVEVTPRDDDGVRVIDVPPLPIHAMVVAE